MTKELTDAYIFDKTGVALEKKVVNDTLFVKFDFLPYPIREFIHTQPDYDESKMQSFPRDCQCGVAYFLEGNHFYNIMKRFNPEA